MATSKAVSQISCIETVDQLKFVDLSKIPARREPRAILMCDPEHFEVKDVKNAFMQGQIDGVDRALARKQWQALQKSFQMGGTPVHVLPPEPDLEDMVFAANQALVGVSEDGVKYVVMGRMRYASRQREVVHYRKWFEQNGYKVLELPEPVSPDKAVVFEGHGDAIWHPGKQLLWGGYGHRTDSAAYPILSDLIGVKVLMLRLVDSRFYHLDTCFCAVSETTVLAHLPAFDRMGVELIKAVFSDVIEVGLEDANNFACNALALGNRVFLERGSKATNEALVKRGFDVVEVDCGEFKKSGGSVFCLKTQVYD